MNRKSIKKAAQNLRKEYELREVSRLGGLRLGADPEFFFKTKKRGAVRGAERVIEKDGLQVWGGKFILDGFQAEINVIPSFCRELLADSFTGMFKGLKAKLDKMNCDLVPDFTSVVNVSKRELRSLSPATRVFGCAPSRNSHEKDEVVEIKVDPAKYHVRAAGGHIHLGGDYPAVGTTLKEKSDMVVDV